MSASASPWAKYEKQISSASSLSDLAEIEHELFGRKSGALTVALKELKDLSAEEKKEAAKDLNTWKKKLSTMIEDRRVELGGGGSEDQIDITLELPRKQRGHLHLIPEFIRQVEEVFGRMGFDVAYGPEIEPEEYNFDLLNFPKEHAARDWADVFVIDDDAPADNKNLLRAHTSPVQVRYAQKTKPPFRMICPGKVYRKDADATHSPMFHQFEGMMIGKDVSLGNMKAVMIQAVRELIDPNAEFRFRTGYFPFTEPSLEIDMRWQGDDEDSREGKWLEIAGCGMTHPNVLKNVGIDPTIWQGFAFGFGVERMLMIKHQIPDLRSFYEGDLRFLRQF